MDVRAARAILARIEDFAARRHRGPIAAFAAFHRFAPHVAAPRRFTEKILWRKLFDRNPRFTLLQDKLAAKAYVHRHCPELTMAPILWQGTRAADIPFASFAGPYIVKCNHGSGFNVAVCEPAAADRAAITVRMAAFLRQTFGVEEHEPAYWSISPRIYVERLLPSRAGAPPADYRLTVIDGRVAYIAADTRPGGRPATDYRDRHWNALPAILMGTPRNPALAPPRSLARMVAMAERLAAGLDMLRVDFYEIDGEPVFGEFTVYPLSGLIPFTPPHFDLALGALWDIRRSYTLANPRNAAWRRYRAALDAVTGPRPAAAAERILSTLPPPRVPAA